ncbi:MAG TPA: hypothetical protein VF498_03465 [Anaerolineales bacterium]
MTSTMIGRLLRAGTSGFVVGCRVSQLETPSFGALVRVPLEHDYQIYGLIHDIRIDDDGLVRQLVTADGVDDNVIADNRVNRNVPVEMSVLAVGYRQAGRIFHLLPPRPPLSLDVIYLVDWEEVCQFTLAGRFGYFRHVLRATDLPVGEILAAHLQLAHEAHCEVGSREWVNSATQELITLLRDDYPTLMAVLGALGDALPIGNKI